MGRPDCLMSRSTKAVEFPASSTHTLVLVLCPKFDKATQSVTPSGTPAISKVAKLSVIFRKLLGNLKRLSPLLDQPSLWYFPLWQGNTYLC